MNEETQPTPTAPNVNPKIVEDTPGIRVACSVFLVVVLILLILAICTLAVNRARKTTTDAEGLYMLGVTIEWLLACICNAAVIEKSLPRLKWAFYKVTGIISLLFAIANVVLFFGFMVSYQ